MLAMEITVGNSGFSLLIGFREDCGWQGLLEFGQQFGELARSVQVISFSSLFFLFYPCLLLLTNVSIGVCACLILVSHCAGYNASDSDSDELIGSN